MVARGIGLVMMCSAVTLFFGGEPFSIRLAPKGKCRYCCPMEEKRDISFHLFTVWNPVKGQLLIPDDDRLLAMSNIDRSLPTVVYIHGFMEDTNGASSMAIKNAYLKRGGWNIILVEWASLCAAPFYVTAVQNSLIVGKYLATFLTYLESRGHPLSTTHVVGFSLGAEVAGFAGKELKGKLNRITGLDPAYPLFHIEGWQWRLHHTDAQFVDVIHSDGGLFGFPTAIGHVDFYPNNGVLFQPGCERLLGGTGTSGISYSYVACSHRRAWKYYVESVTNDCAFVASECVSWNHFNIGTCHKAVHRISFMGVGADRNARGMYFLRTNRDPPFARNYGCPRPPIYSHRKPVKSRKMAPGQRSDSKASKLTKEPLRSSSRRKGRVTGSTRTVRNRRETFQRSRRYS